MRDILIVDDGSEDGVEYVVLKRMKTKMLIAEAGNGIQSYRMKAGLSQGHMAAKLGISQAALSKMETGDLQTSGEMLQKAVKVLIESAQSKPKRNGAKK